VPLTKGINSRREALDPARFKDVVDCVRKVAGYTEASNSYYEPSLAVKLGHSLHKCAAYLKSMALQESNGDLLALQELMGLNICITSNG
jgi:hypothetical protein